MKAASRRRINVVHKLGQSTGKCTSMRRDARGMEVASPKAPKWVTSSAQGEPHDEMLRCRQRVNTPASKSHVKLKCSIKSYRIRGKPQSTTAGRQKWPIGPPHATGDGQPRSSINRSFCDSDIVRAAPGAHVPTFESRFIQRRACCLPAGATSWRRRRSDDWRASASGPSEDGIHLTKAPVGAPSLS